MKKLIEINNKFEIFYDEDNTTIIGLENISHEITINFVIGTEEGYNLRHDSVIYPRTWKTAVNSDYTNLLIRISFKNKIYVYSVKYENKIPNIRKINNYIDFDYSKPINIFCGHEGGGTSVVVKMLRYLNVYFGDDCGSKTNRKHHESQSISFILKNIDNNTPTYVARDLFNQILTVYNYKEGYVNCFKRPGLINKTIKLGEVFPNAKIISIDRKPNGFYSNNEGKRFHEKSELELLKHQRPLIEGNPIFHLDFKRFFTEYNYVNKLLRFLGSDNYLNNDEELNELKKEIDFNDKVLQ